ncbi:GntR family transcriptional regulator [Chelativorans sp. AA-79]|uniref:GntR family transcriptional regulator n=1 Tax=Chelativorans sp. AA-79 TaxID=3028735 RepID=UPI0023F80504|nr:GntR family transcriptional regulator [Chelativorans sp. AA-79]WEX11171.1 GntR family transcriptional regulator [Chelativorans sp. AA-79]
MPNGKSMKQSRAALLRDAIEEDIVTGVYKPGERLDETTLAARHQVSRTPIREALTQLSAMGVVKIQPHRGAFVNEITLPEMIGMFEVMAELEGMCARLAARRMSPQQLDELVAAQADCLAALGKGEADDYYYANERFHLLLYAASGNSFLASTATALHKRLKPYRRLQLRVPGRLERSAAEHENVIAALRARDSAKAEELIESHILVQGDMFSDFLSTMSSLTSWDERQPAKLA